MSLGMAPEESAMSDIDELVKRLRELSKLAGGLAPTIDEAADALEQQSAEILRLEKLHDEVWEKYNGWHHEKSD